MASAVAVTTIGDEKIKSFEGIEIGPPDVACTAAFPNFEPMAGMSLPFLLNASGRVLILFQGQFGEGGPTANARAVGRITVDGVALNAAGAIATITGPASRHSATTRSRKCCLPAHTPSQCCGIPLRWERSAAWRSVRW